MNKALFLDRDGVINTRLVGEYVRHPHEFTLIPGIVPLLQLAHTLGYQLIVITNQQGVGKGLMTRDDLDRVHQHMQALLREVGSPVIDAIYVCCDLADSGSTHRKPAPGMLLDAMRDYQIDASQSWFVGDSRSDAEAGRAAGVKTALIGDYDPSEAVLVAVSHGELVEQLVPLL